MRVGASLLLYNGYCYQSYGWNALRPLGNLQTALDSLDGYEVDEISILRPIKGNDSVVHYDHDIEHIHNIKTTTPLTFGGGIRSRRELNKLAQLPIERIILSSAFINLDEALIKQAIQMFGRQALLTCLPVVFVEGSYFVYHSQQQEMIELNTDIQNMCLRYADEIIIYDIKNEGMSDEFSLTLLDNSPFPKEKIVITGGVGSKTIKDARRAGIASSIIENRVLHSENAIDNFR